MLKDRRLGKFEVGIELVNEHPEVMQNLMSQVIVLEATNSFITDTVTYVALCHAFEKVPAGETTPVYEPEYDQEAEEFTWTKI